MFEPFSWPEDGDRLAVEAAEAGLQRRVLGELAVAGERRPLGDQRLDVVGEVRALRMARHLRLLPRRQPAVDVDQRLVGARASAALTSSSIDTA